MRSMAIVEKDGRGLSDAEIFAALEQALDDGTPLRRVLLLPPDYTRLHSNAGRIAERIWQILTPRCRVDVMPALGTHVPVSRAQWSEMFGTIPYEQMIEHNWRADVETVGAVPGEKMAQWSEGAMTQPVPVEVNRRLLDPNYDLILSIGQVVPHEVAGMANRNKNLFVGCGGAAMINASHMLGAIYGMERIMGRDHTPVRQLFDYAEERFLSQIPLSYILTVTTAPGGQIHTHGLFIGRERARFEQAVQLAREKNLTQVDRPFRRCVVWLDEREFHSTWLGNKAVYRTRMAMADGGELMILAPGVERFGEDPAIDALIRRYGYRGREATLAALKDNEDLRRNLSAAAHLIHGSSDGRFWITYCTRHLSEEEVRGVGYEYLPLDEAIRALHLDQLKPGWNDGDVFFVPNPALGLWTLGD